MKVYTGLLTLSSVYNNSFINALRMKTLNQKHHFALVVPEARSIYDSESK